MVSLVSAVAEISLNKNKFTNNEILELSIKPGAGGVLKYVYFYDVNDKLVDSKVLDCENYVCYNEQILRYLIPSDFDGKYHVAVYDYDLRDYVVLEFGVEKIVQLNEFVKASAGNVCGSDVYVGCDDDGDGYCDNSMSCTSSYLNNYYHCNNGVCTDCNDNNMSIHINGYDICENGIDEDCDGSDAVCALCNEQGGIPYTGCECWTHGETSQYLVYYSGYCCEEIVGGYTIFSYQDIPCGDGVNVSASVSASEDTIISQGDTSKNYGNCPYLTVRGDSKRYSLIKFDLSSLSSNIKVLNAAFVIKIHTWPYTPYTFWVRPLLKPWGEGSGSCTLNSGMIGGGSTTNPGEANWQWAEKDLTDWEIDGGRGSSDQGSYVSEYYDRIGDGYYSFNVTDMVQKWTDGRLTNYGLKFQIEETSTDVFDVIFYSKDSLYTPYIDLSYLVCTDFDNDGKNVEGGLCGAIDCIDYNPYIYPGNSNHFCDCSLSGDSIDKGTTEICGNLFDEDCNGFDQVCPPCGDGWITQRCQCGDRGYDSGYCCGNVWIEGPPSNTKQAGVCVGSKKTCNNGGWVDNYSSVVNYEDPEASCDNLDNDCDVSNDEGCDDDNDNYCDSLMNYVISSTCPNGGNDCNDNNQYIYPNALERCDNLDNQCNGDQGYGQMDEGCDDDNDDYCDNSMVYVVSSTCPNGGNDCNDTNRYIYPNAIEICDSVDNQCTGNVGYGQNDENCNDDNDNYCDNTMGCLSGFYNCNNGTCTDCNDNNNKIYPNAIEICDSVDNQCTGNTGYGQNDENCDVDADTYCRSTMSCLAGFYSCSNGNCTDCNDDNLNIHPGALETCGDSVDMDCNSEDSNSYDLGANCGIGNCADVTICNGLYNTKCGSHNENCGGKLCCMCSTSGLETYDSTRDNDCNTFDLTTIATCNNNPDNIAWTWDTANSFDSECLNINSCSQGVYSFTHTCSKTSCSAPCEVDEDCVDADPLTLDVCLDSCNCQHLNNANCGNGILGDGIGGTPEECELPNTANNTYCLQNISICEGTKTRNRDDKGNCNAACLCREDSYSEAKCVKSSCGASCSVDTDCEDNNRTTFDNCLATCSCENVIVRTNCVDNDLDSYSLYNNTGCTIGNDCDDNNINVNPGKAEDCNTGYDDNCDGSVNEGCSTPPPTTSSGGGGGGGGSSMSVDVDFTRVSEETTTRGVNRELTFTFDGYTIHILTIREIGVDYSVFVVRSTPKEIKVKTGEARMVDVDDNGVYDLEISLSRISDDLRRATFNLKRVSVSIKKDLTKTLPGKTKVEAPKTEIENVVEDVGAKISFVIYVVVAIALLLLFIFSMLFHYRRMNVKKHKKYVINLKDKVNKALNAGYNREDITKDLLIKGWPKEIIDKVFEELKK